MRRLKYRDIQMDAQAPGVTHENGEDPAAPAGDALG